MLDKNRRRGTESGFGILTMFVMLALILALWQAITAVIGDGLKMRQVAWKKMEYTSIRAFILSRSDCKKSLAVARPAGCTGSYIAIYDQADSNRIFISGSQAGTPVMGGKYAARAKCRDVGQAIIFEIKDGNAWRDLMVGASQPLPGECVL